MGDMFSGRLSRSDYARAAAPRLVVFAAGVAAIPAALYVLNRSQYCPPELCGPLAASLITFTVMPVLYIGLMVSLLGITIRRLRDIGLPPALAAVIPLLMLGDLLAALTLDGFVFDSYRHQVAHPIPGNLIMALTCIGFLLVARGDREIGVEFTRRWGALGAIALGAVTLACVVALLKFSSEISMTFGGINSNEALAYAVLYAGALIMPTFVIALFGLLAYRELKLSAA
jgi:uncharacterized membrane protein YhaH (DUF805 family)